MLHLILMLNTMLILMKKDPKFKVGDRVRISKYKKKFSKECTQSRFE